MNRRELLLRGGAAVAALASGGCGARRSLAPGERLLTVWHAWGGVMGPRFTKVAAAFERAHPGVRLRLVYTQNNLSTNQKFFTAVAAGTPPDVTFVDGPQVASWAEWGALEPLTPRVTGAGIQAEEYFTPTWRQNVYEGQGLGTHVLCGPELRLCLEPGCFPPRRPGSRTVRRKPSGS